MANYIDDQVISKIFLAITILKLFNVKYISFTMKLVICE